MCAFSMIWFFTEQPYNKKIFENIWKGKCIETYHALRVNWIKSMTVYLFNAVVHVYFKFNQRIVFAKPPRISYNCRLPGNRSFNFLKSWQLLSHTASPGRPAAVSPGLKDCWPCPISMTQRLQGYQNISYHRCIVPQDVSVPLLRDALYVPYGFR